MTRISYALLLAAVALAPLPLGSNRPWAWTGLAVLTALALMAWAVSALRGHHRGLPQGDGWTVAGLALCACVAAWIWLQAHLAVPVEMQAPLWPLLRQAAALETDGAISADLSAYRSASVRIACYAAVLFLAWELGRDRSRAQGILWCLSAMVVVYAVFGMVEQFAGLRSLGFWPKVSYRYDVTGTLVNRNHFAALLGIGLFATLGLIYGVLRRGGWRHAGLAEVLPTLSVRARMTLCWGAVAALVIVAALFLAHSRGGFLTVAIGLAGALLLAIALRHVRWQSGIGIALLGAAGVFGVGQISGEGLWARFVSNGLVDSERAAYIADTWAMITQRPIFGWGLGAYESIFNGLRPLPDKLLTHYVDRAHNTYLELAAELGVPAAAALLMAAALPAAVCLIAVFRRRASAFALTGTGATLAVALHSWFDFSMQIPAVAVAYFALLGACASQCVSAAQRQRHSRAAAA